MIVRVLAAASIALVVSAGARADGRSASLADAFQVSCAWPIPNFSELDAKAGGHRTSARIR